MDATLAYINEPRIDHPGCNVCVEDGNDPRDLRFAAAEDIPQGSELFVDYGLQYDRSSYSSDGKV